MASINRESIRGDGLVVCQSLDAIDERITISAETQPGDGGDSPDATTPSGDCNTGRTRGAASSGENSSIRSLFAAFLRVVNSFANLAQVRKRLEYVKSVRSPGNTDLLNVALADTRDARVVLADKNLNADVAAQISKAEAIIRSARADKDRNRSAAMKKALDWFDKAAAALFTTTPPDPGTTGGGRSPLPGTGGTLSAGAPGTPSPGEGGGSGGGGNI